MDRLSAIMSAVARRGLDALLIINEHNRFYATGFRSSAGCVIVTEKEAFLYTDSRYIEAARASVSGMTVGLIDARMTQTRWIASTLDACGARTLGFEENYLSFAYVERLRSSLEGLCLVPAQELLTGLRESKGQDEVSAIREAQRISEDVFSRILGIIKPGMTETELAAEIVYRLLRAGAEGLAFDPIVVSGEKSSMPHGKPGNEKIKPGGFLIMDFGCVVRGYCSDMTRTVAVGGADAEMRRVYELVLCAQRAGIAAARAGIPGREIDAPARGVIEAAGFGGSFGHGFGHSLGLEVHEGPSASPSEERLMPRGAVISAEPGIYLPGKFGVRIEDILLLDSDGCENLTAAPKELIVL